MTPSAYKNRYEHLKIPVADGPPKEVSVNQYRLKGLKDHDVNEDAWKDFYGALTKYHVDMELHVDPGARSYRILHRNQDSTFYVTEQTRTGMETVQSEFLKKISGMARYCFLGKGAPEHCQIVLQLVDHWKLLKGLTLQQWADNALGLDCNGFVGNFLWHVHHHQSWTNLGLDRGEEGPDVSIDGYFDRRKAIRRWEDLKPSQSYIMGWVDGAGRVIPGGKASDPGHIVITQPGTLRPSMNGAPPNIGVVESTASHVPGLCETTYSLISIDRNGIFTMNRQQMSARKILPFKVAPA